MERSQELLDAYIRAAEKLSQGTDAPGELFSSFPDVSSFGTAPDEWWLGRDTLIQVVETERQAREGLGLSYLPGHPDAWAEGDFGWVTDQPVIRLPNGHEQAFRLTSVMHKENGTWKVVHQHFSLGVPNEEVEPFAQYATFAQETPQQPTL